MNIASFMARAGKAYADSLAVAVGRTPWLSYGELAGRVAALAGGLRQGHAIEPGKRVAIFSHNCPEYLETLYAIWHAGAIAVPINAKLHPREAAYILRHSRASLCFVAPKAVAALAPTAGDVTLVAIGGEDYRALLAAPATAVAEVERDAPAWIFYTSGTTGRPKGATLSHANLLAMSFCYFADVDPIGPWPALLHAAPMSHGSGLYALPYVMQAGCHVIPESGGFDVGEVYDLIAAWPGLAFFAAPTMVKRLVDDTAPRDTTNLKAIIYGGGPMYHADCLAALARFGGKMTQLYGQGETPMTITALNARQHDARDHPRWRERLQSVGIAQSAVAVRVVDDDGADLPPGVTGEIVVRGDTVMLGYWNDSAATATAIRDGWLRTGDHGAFDDDGFLTLKDRSKDVIISGGTNIYPREIEEILLQHESVAEVAVIARPDAEWGEAVVAYVVAQDGALIDTAVLDAFCVDHIARFKKPRHYRFVPSLPKNSYGKVLKRELRAFEAATD